MPRVILNCKNLFVICPHLHSLIVVSHASRRDTIGDEWFESIGLCSADSLFHKVHLFSVWFASFFICFAF